MPYLDCPDCRLTDYVATRLRPLVQCPRCGSKRRGKPGRIFRQVRKFQRSVGGAPPNGSTSPSASG